MYDMQEEAIEVRRDQAILRPMPEEERRLVKATRKTTNGERLRKQLSMLNLPLRRSPFARILSLLIIIPLSHSTLSMLVPPPTLNAMTPVSPMPIHQTRGRLAFILPSRAPLRPFKVRDMAPLPRQAPIRTPTPKIQDGPPLALIFHPMKILCPPLTPTTTLLIWN